MFIYGGHMEKMEKTYTKKLKFIYVYIYIYIYIYIFETVGLGQEFDDRNYEK